MFVCVGTYARPLVDSDEELITAHRAYLDELYRGGQLVASGPREPRIGGLIVARGADDVAVRKLLAADPFVMSGLVEYELLRFTPSKGAHPDLIENYAPAG
ncbi:MAG: YciI family protein [Mycobacterium sp.]